jgi:8-oxo-dGTP pyrophosphatase MutT (NUDIX family)
MNVAASNTSTESTTQVAALPLRTGSDGTLQVLLVTSRETRRWVIPKGWPMKGLKPCEAAAQEALEEAGLKGHVENKPVGTYTYFKRCEAHFAICDVDVYLLKVDKQLKDWREKDQRKARWCTLQEAADLVQEPGLAALFLDLSRSALPL